MKVTKLKPGTLTIMDPDGYPLSSLQCSSAVLLEFPDGFTMIKARHGPRRFYRKRNIRSMKGK